MTPTKMKTIIAVYDEPVQVLGCSPEWTLDRINGWVDFETHEPLGFRNVIRNYYGHDPCQPRISIQHMDDREQHKPGVVRIYNHLLIAIKNDKKITFREE